MLLQSTPSPVRTQSANCLFILIKVVLMAVARNIGDASQSIKNGKWERSRLTGVEAKGKTLAIVGLGKGMFKIQSSW
jgi:lactate dehydrogenase-like 2-hydroxyacid dehydrogenase